MVVFIFTSKQFIMFKLEFREWSDDLGRKDIQVDIVDLFNQQVFIF